MRCDEHNDDYFQASCWQAQDSSLLNMSFALVNVHACQITLLRTWPSALSTGGCCVFCTTILVNVAHCSTCHITHGFMQVHRTAHNIHEAGRQTWSTARQSVTRPSSLLSIFSRSKPDEEWGSSDNAQDNADHRRQLLRYSNDHESNEAQEASTDDK